MIYSKPYVILGPVYSGKTSLLIQLTCILTRIERKLQQPILHASFPSGMYKSAQAACRFAEPLSTMNLDYVTITREWGGISWLAPSGLPEEGSSKEDFIYSIEIGPSVLGLVFDMGIGFEIQTRNPIDATIKMNTRFYEMLFNTISGEEARLIPFLRHPTKIFICNKIDILLKNNLNIREALNIASHIRDNIASLSENLLGFDLTRDVKLERGNLTFALKTGEIKQNLIEFRYNAFNILIEPIFDRFTSKAKEILQEELSRIRTETMAVVR